MSLPEALVWASNDVYAAGSEEGNPTKSEPASGRKEDGFSPETKPVPQEWNWAMNLVAQWIAYLKGGDLELTGLTLDLAQTIDLSSSASWNDLDVSGGAGSLAQICYVVIGDASADTTITGITHTTPGRVLVLQNRGGYNLILTNNDSSSASTNRLFLPASTNLVIPPYGTAILIGTQTEDTGHGWLLLSAPDVRVQTRMLPASSGIVVAGDADTIYSGYWAATAGSDMLVVPLPVAIGERIVNVRIKAACGVTTVIRCQLYRVDPAGLTRTQLGSDESTTGHAGALETVAFTDVGEIATSDYNYLLELFVTAYSGAGQVWGVELDVD